MVSNLCLNGIKCLFGIKKAPFQYQNDTFFIPNYFKKNERAMENQLTPFEGINIRKIWQDEQWYFSVVDIIGVLTDSQDPSNYWTTIKLRDKQLPTICRRFKMTANDGKQRLTDCATAEGVFRIIMSVPSPKAEPLKLWLAEQGKRTIDEAENPELLTERQAELYRAKGYTEEWIGKRVQTIETRKELTDEWKGRGVKENQEYSILTATIAKGTFGLSPSEHSKLKGLDRQNLRDHMTPMELILTAFSEEATRLLAIDDDAQGFNENHDAATKGGKMAGEARERLESQLKKPVVSSDNFLGLKGGETPDSLPSEGKKD
jgi:DNA-damage-inducible protein D